MATVMQPAREQLELSKVLEALSNPIRLDAVARMAARTAYSQSCGEVLPELPKSTATHHWRILRESGVVDLRREGRNYFVGLRRDDLDACFPGLLDAVLAAI